MVHDITVNKKIEGEAESGRVKVSEVYTSPRVNEDSKNKKATGTWKAQPVIVQMYPRSRPVAVVEMPVVDDRCPTSASMVT